MRNVSNALLDAVKRRHALPSDYALARILEVTTQAVSLYRTGKAQLGEETACRVAALLERDPAAVLVALAAERSHSEAARRAWRDAVKRLGGLAAGVLLAVGAISAPSPAQADQAPDSGAVCIMSNRRRRPVAPRAGRRRAPWTAPLARIALALPGARTAPSF